MLDLASRQRETATKIGVSQATLWGWLHGRARLWGGR